jgi:hypothetical protein
MNQTEAVRGDIVQLVGEHIVPGIEEGVHGVAFDGKHLVVAAGYRIFRLVPDTGWLIDQLETSPSPGGLAFDGRHLWQCSEDRFQRIELRTGFVVRGIARNVEDVTGLECIESDLLVLHAKGGSLARIETLDATIVEEAQTTVPLQGLAWLRGELWSSTEGELVRIDPVTARVLARVAVPPGLDVCDLAADTEGRLWSVDANSPSVRAFVLPRQ